MTDLLKLARRNVTRHKGRTALTLVSVVFGVVALILAGGFIEDTIVEVGEAMIHSYSGHVQVSREGYAAYGSQSPEKYLIEHPERMRQRIAGNPEVDDVLLRIAFSGMLSNGRSDWSIVGEGIEPEREARLGSYVTVASGRRLTAADKYATIIGQGVARALDVKTGDRVTLLVSTGEGAINTLDLEIAGIFQTFSKDYDARAVRIPLAAARELMATNGVHSLVISLKKTTATEQIAASERLALLGTGFELRTWVELNDFYAQTVVLYRQQFGFLVVIVLIMILLSVSNTVNLGIFERVGEFGTMLAIGNRSRSVYQLIVTEGLLLGVIGSGLGVAIGVALAAGISAVGIPMPPPPNADLGYTSRILIVPEAIAVAFAIGIIATVLASLMPARHVSRMQIAAALRHNV